MLLERNFEDMKHLKITVSHLNDLVMVSYCGAKKLSLNKQSNKSFHDCSFIVSMKSNGLHEVLS